MSLSQLNEGDNLFNMILEHLILDINEYESDK
jgi:hypothetical protein